jgi:hypothetical protein
MALDILAIPVMADDPERAFSEGRLIVTDQRCAMSESTLEEIMCTRQWMRCLGNLGLAFYPGLSA